MTMPWTNMSNDLGLDGKGKEGTQMINGLITPNATPGVDDGRIEADKVRQAEEAAASNSTDQNMEENPGGQDSAANFVMSRDPKDYRGILDIKKSYDNPVEEKTAILSNFRGLGTLLHPEFNKDEQAEDAFARVLRAAKSLGVEKKYLKEMKNWDGVNPEFAEVNFSEEAPKDEPQGPSNAIQEIYKEAPKYLEGLFVDSTDLNALGGLRALNEKIKTQNGKDGVTPAERWTIDIGNLGAHYNSAKPLFDRFVKNELDEEARLGLEGIRAEMAKSYHDIFIFPVPTPETRRETAAVDKVAADKAAADKAAADKAAVDKAAAKKFGNIEFPWVTYPLPTGERIIAGRQRTKDEVSGSLCCVELPCTDPEDPTFEFRDDIDILELQKYFATPGIKLMGETDEKGRPVKVWRKVDRKDFRKFLFCVVGKRERSDLRKRTTTVCPEVLCGVVMADGVNILNKTGLLNMIGKKAEEGYIRRYCEKKGITPPWDVKPNSWIIADDDKELLSKLKSERLNSISPVVNSTPVIPTAGNSEIKSVLDKLAALERRIEVLQAPSTGGRSLDEIFSKLEALETRVAKVDELSVKMDKTTAILDALCKKVGL